VSLNNALKFSHYCGLVHVYRRLSFAIFASGTFSGEGWRMYSIILARSLTRTILYKRFRRHSVLSSLHYTLMMTHDSFETRLWKQN